MKNRRRVAMKTKRRRSVISSKMGGRKWEDLDVDCLANVFGRVGLQSLVLDIPFVYKSWYEATLNLQCWETLVFPELYYKPSYIKYNSFPSRFMDLYKIDRMRDFPVTQFIKSVVDRSCGRAKLIELPSSGTTTDVLEYIADECPELKVLLLSEEYEYEVEEILPSLVSKWKNLESLRIEHLYNWLEILSEINIHCEKFTTFAMIKADMRKEAALSIVATLPNITHLSLRCTTIERENLMIILQGCKQLVELDVSECCGFDVDDEILKLASHITNFLHEGSSEECMYGCC